MATKEYSLEISYEGERTQKGKMFTRFTDSTNGNVLSGKELSDKLTLKTHEIISELKPNESVVGRLIIKPQNSGNSEGYTVGQDDLECLIDLYTEKVEGYEEDVKRLVKNGGNPKIARRELEEMSKYLGKLEEMSKYLGKLGRYGLETTDKIIEMNNSFEDLAIKLSRLERL